jgi:hypothetical protein
VWLQGLADDRGSLLVMEAEFGRPCSSRPLAATERSDGVTVRHVRVQATPEAVRLVQEQGGQLYVWAKRSRCCHGSLTFLETSREPRERRFRRVDADGIELYLDQSLGNPEELVIEAKGRRRKHVHAYWDGCAYVV